MSAIRKYLDISHCNIHEVLYSEANPILSLLNEALVFNTNLHKTTSIKELERLSLLEKYDFDLSRVEALIRSTVSKNTSIARVMQPYIQLVTKGLQINNIDIRSLVT